MLDLGATTSLLARRPERTALLSDFDGTLAKIVDDPASARPLPSVVPVLSRLCGAFGRVGIVSGRPVDFLAEHVPVPGLVLVGQYGLESLVDGVIEVDRRVLPYRDAIAAAADVAETRLPDVYVERKGVTAVTLHYRTAPDAAAAVRRVAEDLASTYGLDRHPGRKSIELRPPVPVDKGITVRRLVDGFAVGAFAGDDAGDLPAFAALADAARRDGLEAAVRIGVDSPEAPAALRGAVDVMVEGPEGVVALFDALVHRVEG